MNHSFFSIMGDNLLLGHKINLLSFGQKLKMNRLEYRGYHTQYKKLWFGETFSVVHTQTHVCIWYVLGHNIKHHSANYSQNNLKLLQLTLLG